MSTQINECITLQTETCCNCSIIFAMPHTLYWRLKTSGGEFYCPNGHGQHYTQTENMRLQKLLEASQRDLRQAKCETLAEQQKTQTEQAERLKAERKLKRVQRGVCPCCNRFFSDLSRHMETKHSEKVAAK